MSDLVPRETVEDMVRQRDQMMESYRLAHEHLVIAQKFLEAARFSFRENRYNVHLRGSKGSFHQKLKLPVEEEYLEQAQRIVDSDFWARLIEMTDLERLMDKQAKDEFAAQIQDNPPEVTIDNVYATLNFVLGSAGDMFRRGIANAFSKLDRRFKSHDGWKIGSRVILNSMFNEHGCFSYYRNHRDTIRDVERVFYVLDERLVPQVSEAVHALECENRDFFGPGSYEVETGYFKIRVFKNGNCHLWFKRKDLVEKVNKLLAEYYGEVLAEGEVDTEERKTAPQNTSLAKGLAYFPTPEKVVKELIGFAWSIQGKKVLEPSAGTGNIARVARERGADVDCIEIDPGRVEELRRQGFKTTQSDFLLLQPSPKYDFVLMNPPFDRGRDIEHVEHALKWLKPGGVLLSVMSASTEFRMTKRAKAFRKKVYRFIDLPERSFKECNTNVNTCIVEIRV